MGRTWPGRQRIDVHGIEKGEAFGRQRGRREPLCSPVVVRVAGIHVFVGLHKSVELRAETVFYTTLTVGSSPFFSILPVDS